MSNKIEIRKVVRVCCGQGIRGKARGYAYFQVSSFAPAVRKSDGEVTLRKVECVAGPFRSRAKCERIAQDIANSRKGYLYIPGYGSLHGALASQI